MNILEYIKPQYVVYPLAGLNLEEIYSELLSVFNEKKIDKQKNYIIQNLINREEELSQQIATGIYLPHMRVDKIKEFYLSIGLVPDGIMITGVEDPVNLFFLELAPMESINQHIFFISEIAKLVLNINLEKLITNVMTPGQLYSSLTGIYKSLER